VSSSPPWILATIVCCVNAWHAGIFLLLESSSPTFRLSYTDKTGERFFHIAGWWWIVIIGYIIGVSTLSTGGRYVSMFLMTLGYVGENCPLDCQTCPSTCNRVCTNLGLGL
jgi:hypothetical protein